MKCFYTLILVFYSVFSFSQEDYQAKEKKNSIGVFISTAEFTFWTYNMKVNEEWSSPPKHLYVVPNKPFGVAYQYKLNRLLKLQCGIAFDKEHFLYDAIVGGENIYINYNVDYLKVALGARVYLSHLQHEDAIGGFFFQVNGSFDFVIKEDIQKKSSQFVDPRFQKPPNYVYPPETITETNSDQWKFHRIRPSIFIGHEIVLDNISFFYGGRFEMVPIYQSRNLQEYFKNRNFSFLDGGLNYRF